MTTIYDSAKDWRSLLRQNFTQWEALADFLELDAAQRTQIWKTPRFLLNLPLRLARKIGKGRLDDPILRQFLPSMEEQKEEPGFTVDPLGEKTCRRGAKLLHKYRGRVLLVCSNACAVHCRYCFRQHFDYQPQGKTFDEELRMIAADPSIHEVILSGGDPLTLPDNVLKSLLDDLSVIPHLRRIRFHSRFPIGIPERIDAPFLRLLEALPQQVWFVIHCNHPRELDEDVFAALRSMQRLGVVVLNQTVLLRGVNDDVDTLRQLCESLVGHGIVPYYLHQLDRARGTAHFEVPESRGLELIKELGVLLPGFAVPKYVKEIAGEPQKTPLLPVTSDFL